MRIALAADHAGFEFKARLARELGRLGHDVTDFGTGSTDSCDYPDYAIPAARARFESAIRTSSRSGSVAYFCA